MTVLRLTAPLTGWLGSLEEAPDAVFAERMMGDGVAIDPLAAEVSSPCDAMVIAVHATRHAVTLRADNGAELLIHVGLDTVTLGGDGFTAHVAGGDRVTTGMPLLTVDLDAVSRGATSLLTPVVLTNGDAFEITRRAAPQPIRIGDWLMDIVPRVDAAPVAGAQAGNSATASARVALDHGLHARPAAQLAAIARRFDAVAQCWNGDRHADVRSAVSVMALGLRHGDTARFTAGGGDAEAAVAALTAFVSTAGAADLPVAAKSTVPRSPMPAAGLIQGVTAAPGLAIGIAVRVASQQLEPPANGAGVVAETAALAQALEAVRNRWKARATGKATAAQAIAAAHLELLDDPEISRAAHAAILDGRSAGAAWRAAMAVQIAAFVAVADPRIASRADDLRDLEAQVIAATLGIGGTPAPLPDRAILIATDLLPSQLMAVDAACVAGFCTAAGGPTSHVAIIAASMGIPAVVAAGDAVLDIADGQTVILDGDAATLDPAPSLDAIAAARQRIDQLLSRRSAARVAAVDDCRMADGTRIEIFANLGSLADADAAISAGAEGCGLLRTELLFLDRARPPDVQEQAMQYQAIADTLAGRPLIIRTLDIGGDKPVAYLAIPREDNPALGLRGIRVGLWQPALLETQLAAILQVRSTGARQILVPMIASLDELLAVRRIIDRLDPASRVPVGVMIETPAAAVTADTLAAHADFFAIGTNDLAQYTLAMDRGNPLLAAQADALHPAVLRLIAQTVAGAARHGRPVGVCGGLASDVAAAAILIGLGVTELSAVSAVIPELKAQVRSLTMAGCAELAERALSASSAAAVRALAAL